MLTIPLSPLQQDIREMNPIIEMHSLQNLWEMKI